MQNHLHIPVSQYAKMPLPTPKSPATNSLEVRQQPKISLHTPTHTGEPVTLTDNIDPKKITDFIAVVRSLHPQYKIAFAPHSFLTTQLNDCSKANTDLFFNLVQTFTLLHHRNRRTTVENVLVACDSDYDEAFKLWQHCQPKQKFIAMTTLQKVYQFLQYRYENKNFTSLKVAAQLNYNNDYINTILQQLLQQNKIELIPNTDNKYQRLYQLKK
jgi:hypothetical protein